MNNKDFAGLTDWVEIFKGGEQTDNKGRTQHFSEADLDQIVANHDPEHPAPHVITHKELYSPFAYGQTAALKREGLSVFAKSKKINPTFEKLVGDGALYERSIRIEKTPKGYKLGHIAWLGAEPPAVEGLAPVKMFSKDDADCFDFNSPPTWLLPDGFSRFMRGIRDWMIAKFGIETADQVVPNYQIDSMTDMATRMRGNADYSQSDGGHTVQFTQADINRAKQEAEDKAQADFARREQELKDRREADRLQFEKERAEFRRNEYADFIRAQIDDDCRVTPAQIEGGVEFMAAIAAGRSEAFEFSRGEEGKAQTVQATPVDWFKNFVKALPKQITLGRREGEGAEVDGADAAAIAKAATEYQAEQAGKGIEISASAAVAHVTKGGQ